MLAYVDAALATSGGPYLLGEQITVVDVFLFMLGRWSRGLQQPARSFPHLGAFMHRMLARPAIQKTFDMEGLQAPLF